MDTAKGHSSVNDDVLLALKSAISNGWIRNVHGVVIYRHGHSVFEEYFAGEDEILGRSLGHRKFGPDVLHDARSITKSVVSLLYGIALSEGIVPPLNCPLHEAFDEYAGLLRESGLQELNVWHALTMSLGLEWDESLPYWDPRNDERQMCAALDKCRFVFSRSQVSRPGERWCYNGGATVIIAKLIEKGTNRSLADYARYKLFNQLGIESFEWTSDESGEPSAAGGLRMTPRDLAKIGQLILNKGTWHGTSLVPAQWIEESIKQHIAIDPDKSYGYFWTLSNSIIGDRVTPLVAAIGYGGQRIYILPEVDAVAVITAGNYRQAENWRAPTAVLNQYVLPAIAAVPNSSFDTDASRRST